ncbi:MAG: DEAD/DEAH box helicase [Kineosporiaceae bacterium]
MSTPAERYAASRARQSEQRSPLGRFVAGLPFDLDDFQVEACRAVAAGHGVLVAAPTGAGKTVVGEYAIFHALQEGRKAFYTTPIKALSNQKYSELVTAHGADSVGLLTGDVSVNGEAPVVVMTTEVLRNMIYAGSPTLRGLGWVVMDEVHYLADRFRGAVWEEVIIHLPDDVTLVSLSATVSNAEEFGDWLATVRGDTRVVVSEHRPVPLWQHVLVDRRLHDLFVDPEGDPVLGLPGESRTMINPELMALATDRSRVVRRAARGGGRERPRPRRTAGPGRVSVIETLDRHALLPGIVFVFSRAGCDAAVAQCLAAGLRLTTPSEREAIRRVVTERTAGIPPSDLAVLGVTEWSHALERGLAAHHAGLLPAFKETVETLFQQGLVKVVFATETLALGVNMPARSVVLERLVKWNGESHADLTPGEYTQLTGRAGRRGIDIEGHAVVVWSDDLDPEHVAGLASTRTYPLRSSFRPTYSMAVNLVGTVGRDAARQILETSFAQFQADRAVVGLARTARRQAEAVAGYTESMTCHLGDIEEYVALRRDVTRAEERLSRRQAHRGRRPPPGPALRRGDVIHVPSGRRSGWAVVLDPGSDRVDAAPTVLTADRQVRRLAAADLAGPVEATVTVRIPRGFSPGDPRARRDLVSSMRNALAAGAAPRPRPAGGEDEIRPHGGDDGHAADVGNGLPGGEAPSDERALATLRRSLRHHPCHGCADLAQHLRWADRRDRTRADHDATQRRVEGRTASIARAFDRVCEVLTELRYLDGDSVTEHGDRLSRIYSQSDLLVAECLRAGVWDGLDAPGLAAAVSALVYESRREGAAGAARPPGGRVASALDGTMRVWSRVRELEEEHRTTPTPEPDPGFARPVLEWARGASLGDVLDGAEMTPGDFVRWCRQSVDLLDQIAGVLGPADPVGAAAATAVRAVRRGVVVSTVS